MQNGKIVEYKTLIAENTDELDCSINEMIKKGWQPYGYQSPVRCSETNEGAWKSINTLVMSQVMVRYEEL